jgi:large subunit ribosomal protein L20
MRVTISPVKRRKHKRVLREAKGYRGQQGRCYRKAKQQLLNSYNKSFADRKKFKGNMRALWIIRINALLRERKITYSRFWGQLRSSDYADSFDRKLLASMAINNTEDFWSVVDTVMRKGENFSKSEAIQAIKI